MYADLVAIDLSALVFYEKNRIQQPTQAEAVAAIARYQKGRDVATLATNVAGLVSGGLTLAPMAPVAITACLANITLCAIQAAEVASGSALGPAGTGVGSLAGRAGLKSVLSAEQANAQWMAGRAGNSAAWTEGTAVLQGEIAAGTTIRMYVNTAQAERLRQGDLTVLGGWATFDDPAKSVTQMRNNMALTEQFKPAVSGPFYVVELQVTKPMPANVGFVGPQLDMLSASGTALKYQGGGTQIQLTDYVRRTDYLRVIVPPKCVGKC